MGGTLFWVSLNADRATLTHLDTGSGQFDQALEKIGLSTGSSACNPQLLPGFVSFPIESMVEQAQGSASFVSDQTYQRDPWCASLVDRIFWLIDVPQSVVVMPEKPLLP